MFTPGSAIQTIQSKKLQDLLPELKTFSTAELDNHFWKIMKTQGGTPLIEDDPNNPNNRIVTFLWRGTTIPANQDSEQQIYVVRETERYKANPITENDRLRNIPGTNIYCCSQSLRRDLLTSYSFYIQPEEQDLHTNLPTNMQEQITQHGSYPDIYNQHQFTLHPDPAQRQRHAILDLEGKLRNNPFVPSTRKEADDKLNELIKEKRWIQDTITVPKPEEKEHREYLNSCELYMDIADNEPVLLATATEWKGNNNNNNKILMIKDKSTDAWSIFSPQFGAKISDFDASNLLQILQDIDPHSTLPDATKKLIKQEAISFYLSSLDKRDYSVYLPKKHDPNRAEPYPVMIQLDGRAYTDMGIPFLLDKLTDANVIKPTVVVFLHSAFWINLRPVPENDTSQNERSREYNANPSFIDFIAKQFLPLIWDKYNGSHQVKDNIMQGSSSGGACAILAGLMGAVGQVIADSPVLLMNPEVERVQLKAIDDFIQQKRKTDFITTMGIYETRELVGYNRSLFEGFQKMSAIVEQKKLNSQFSLTQVCSEHEFLRWFSEYSNSLIKAHQHISAEKTQEIKSTADMMKTGIASKTSQKIEPTSLTKTEVSLGNQQNTNINPDLQQQTPAPKEPISSKETTRKLT